MAQPAYPCDIDVARARTVYVPNLDPQKLREAPFSYLYARREAKSVLLVPWEAGQINRPRALSDPIYVFSPGRCGSTLLHNILTTANVNSVSEPHVYDALLSRSYRENRFIRPLVRWATRIYVRDLVTALGDANGTLVAKLHGGCSWIYRELLDGSRAVSRLVSGLDCRKGREVRLFTQDQMSPEKFRV